MKIDTEQALDTLGQRVAVLHYAPISETVVGEPIEIFPWLGCSRLEEPINRYPATLVVHGHAHRGAPEGRTGAASWMRQVSPSKPHVR